MADTTGSIDSLLTAASSEAYTARASILDDTIDLKSSTVTGDRNSALFTAKNELGKMDFLKLLVMQMQFQDPLQPTDNTEFVAQMAQFSSLEGNMNIEKAINNLNESFQKTVDAQGNSATSITNASAVSLIGKEVRMMEKQVYFSGAAGTKVPIRVHLGNHDGATVEIRDADGNVLRTLTTSGKDGENSTVVEWDGLTDEGKTADSGSYDIYIQGEDTDSSLYAFVEDSVEGVRFSGTGPLVKIGGQELPVSVLMDVSTGNSKTGFEGLSSSSAIALLGKTVRVKDDSVTYVNKGGEAEPSLTVMKASLGSLTSATLEIVDASGNVVFSEREQADQYGNAEFTWDGRNMDTSDFVPTGVYTVRLAESANNSDVYIYSEGVVDGVSNLADGAQIRINGKTVPLSSILDISNESGA
jgi:flagellar basal-body rod modification protein FlgD